jgi:hypothetical protein
MRASAIRFRRIFRPDSNLRFCRRAAWLVLAAITAGTSLSVTAQETTTEPTSGYFLEWPKEQRDQWLNGAFATLAHAAGLYDKAKGDCVAKWYYTDRAAKQKVIEGMMTRNPAMDPTTIVIGIATTACKGIFPAAPVLAR